MNNPMTQDEQQRIFDDWLREHKSLFFKIVRSYAFNLHDQNDLFQEIAHQVWNSIPKFRGDSKPSSWIYKVAIYAAIRWSKKRKNTETDTETLMEKNTFWRKRRRK